MEITYLHVLLVDMVSQVSKLSVTVRAFCCWTFGHRVLLLLVCVVVVVVVVGGEHHGHGLQVHLQGVHPYTLVIHAHI